MIVKKTAHAFKTAKLWNLALDDASEDRYSSALKSIEEIEKLHPLFPEMEVFKGFLLYALGKHSDSFSPFSSGMRRIMASKKFSADEKAYFSWYCQRCIDEKKLIGSPNFECKEFNMQSVSKRIKKNFPIRDHPLWEELN